jgi:hypothetical protein
VSLFRFRIGWPNAGPHWHIAGTGSDRRLTLTLSRLRDALCRHLHIAAEPAPVDSRPSVQNCSLGRREVKFGCG